MWFCIRPCGDRNSAVGDAFDLQGERETWAAIAATEAIEVGARNVEASSGPVTGKAGRVDPARQHGLLLPRPAASARSCPTHCPSLYPFEAAASRRRRATERLLALRLPVAVLLRAAPPK